MSRQAKAHPDEPSSELSALDNERKGALGNLRSIRSTGQKNLALGCKVGDFRELIDTPAMGCGVAAYLNRVLRDPALCQTILDEGEAIYRRFRGVPRLASGETILHVDPLKAERLAMALAGAGLKPGPRQAGWATFRGPVAMHVVQSLLDGLAVQQPAYRLHEIEAFVSLPTEVPSPAVAHPGLEPETSATEGTIISVASPAFEAALEEPVRVEASGGAATQTLACRSSGESTSTSALSAAEERPVTISGMRNADVEEGVIPPVKERLMPAGDKDRAITEEILPKRGIHRSADVPQWAIENEALFGLMEDGRLPTRDAGEENPDERITGESERSSGVHTAAEPWSKSRKYVE